MAVEIIKGTKEINIKKDCQTCQHLNVCKFHSEMKKLTTSNEWFIEFNYNSLRAFEQHSDCRHYIYKFSFNLNDYQFLDPNLVSQVIRDSGIKSYTMPDVNKDWNGIVDIFPKGETFNFKKEIKKYKLFNSKL